MKAVVYDKKQKPYKLSVQDIPKPIPGPGELLVKVHTSSVNAADYRAMGLGIIPRSRVFGAAVVGQVEEVGKGVSGFAVGDEVIGDVSDFGYGGHAEFISVNEKAFTKKPDGLSAEYAATLPVAATTAYRAVLDKGRVEQGKTVLIVGSSGGVGIFATQLAKHFGGDVTAVCSTKNVEQSKELGAIKVLDYTTEDIFQKKERYDVILAVNGNHMVFKYKRLLNPNGRYVMVGGTMKQIFSSMFFGWLLSFGSKKMLTLAAKSDSKDLAIVADLMANGHLKPGIDKSYSFEEIPVAMAEVGEGHTPGKVVINVMA